MLTDEKKTPATAWAVLEQSTAQPLDHLWNVQAIVYTLKSLNPDIELDPDQIERMFIIMEKELSQLQTGLSVLESVRVVA